MVGLLDQIGWLSWASLSMRRWWMGWASTEQKFGTAQLVSEKVNLITRVIVRNYFIVLLYQSIFFITLCVDFAFDRTSYSPAH